MSLCNVVFIVILAVGITAIIADAISDRKLWYLRRENRMLRRLLSEQADLHEMSFNAYISMLQEMQRHNGNDRF